MKKKSGLMREVVPNLIDHDEHIKIENETLNQEET